jgi:hypothetical protein
LLVDELDISVQAPAHLVPQAVDLLLQEQESRILFFSGAHLPPLAGILPKEEKEPHEQDAEKDEDRDLHCPKANRKSSSDQPISLAFGI